MKSHFSSCLITLFFIFTSPYAYSGECSGWFSSEPKLSTYMKRLMSEGIPIPVTSSDLANVATFKNLIIYWERDGASGTVTGERPDFASLKKAKGHAEVVFQLKSKVSRIPKIRKYIESYRCNLLSALVEISATVKNNHNEILDMNEISSLSKIREIQSEIRSYLLDNYTCDLKSIKLGDVTAEALLIGNDKKVVARKVFELEEGMNKVVFCDFAELKQNVSKIEVKVKNYPVSFSSKLIKKIRK